jgi:hypothetical protein
MDPIWNERIKLLATALNSAAVSTFSVGVLAPIATVFYAGSGKVGLPPVLLAVGAGVWLLVAAMLHMVARRVLGRMRT